MRALVVAVGVLAAGLGGGAAAQPTGRVVGTVKISDADGQPAVADVVVYVLGFNEPPSEKVTTIAQKGRKFVPALVAVTAGEKVEFPNFDPFLHNVFSQSPPRKFDLGSFPKGETKEISFPETGVVDVYCNIHPEMAATIIVLPNRRHTVAGPDGKFVIDGVPPGDWTVWAFSRRARPVSAKVTVKPGADTTADLAIVRGAEPAHLNKYGEKYKDGGPTYR
ncbi:MAG TPA: plastocyanin/azurin family copper-binding protein [Kofleriaceae bacterium]|jgi:plastocyanin|nr:plastocyanin/azurin family copper-binding protein [Kofleriaceae bacterium]